MSYTCSHIYYMFFNDNRMIIDQEPPLDIVPGFLYSSFILAIWYMILQIGDFYFYATLPEQYVAIKGFDIPVSLWLLANGIFGIQTAMFYVIYQWYRMLTGIAVPHLTCTVFLFLAFGISWTLTGWSCVYHIVQKHYHDHNNHNDNQVFEMYMYLKLGIQTMFFTFGYCIFFPCEN